MNYTRLLITDLYLSMYIGVYQHEKDTAQRVLVNIEADIGLSDNWESDDLENTVSYEDIVNVIQALSREKHYNLVETFAEQIATTCLSQFPLKGICVQIEKPDIIQDTKSVGVKVFRSKNKDLA